MFINYEWFLVGQEVQPPCFYLLVAPTIGDSKNKITFVCLHMTNFSHPHFCL